MRTHSATLAVLLAASLAACGGDSAKPKSTSGSGQTQTPQEPAEEPSGPSTPAAPQDSGAKAPAAEPESTDSATKEGPMVTFDGKGGQVMWVGNAPGPRTLEIGAEASKGCHEGGPVDAIDRGLLIDILGGVANVVIEVEVAGAAAEVGEAPYVMDQKGCRYEPHVLVVPAGGTVEYRNSDSVGHNVHTYARRNDSMNKTVAANGSETQVYGKTDQVEVKCDIHPWMQAWVIVSDASATAVSGLDGSFTLPDLPAGEHKVSCWHEELGKASGTLVVAQDGSIAKLELAIKKKR